MKKFYVPVLLFATLFFYSLTVFTQIVSFDKAKAVGLNFYNERLTAINASKQIANLKDLTFLNEVKSSEGFQSFYVFDVKNGGFVIVSGHESSYPVLGYSLDNKFLYPVTCPSFISWLENYDRQIKYAFDNDITPDIEMQTLWNEYMSPQTIKQKDIKAVTPLLLTTWDQNRWYNEMCPVDAAGDGGHVYAGCVATSMAQVMKYYNYPLQGSGTNSYNSPPYGVQSANFGTTYYRWNEMPLSLTSSNSAVAELLYHCGVSVNMNYSPNGSSASTTTAASALKNKFKYASSASYKSKYTYTTTNWNNLLKGNLDIGRPMIYSGSPSSGAGHAWNCDGYQGTDHFHMNWGWSGYYNGYFYLNALNVAGDDFSYFQGAVVDIYPGQNYPYNCTGTKTLTGTIGTFDDGSGPSNYQNNSDCYWLIDPTITVAKIKLSFDIFNTESNNDVVTVYDGDNTSAPVLGTFSGSTIPSMITSNTNKVLVRFNTNATGNAAGWHASYTTTFPSYCVNLTNLTAVSDTFSDGSGSNQYNPVTTCRWRIAPPGASSITLSFTDFDLPNVSDVVDIYDVSSGNVLLDSYTGTSIPASKSYNASKLMVWFKTNTSNPGQGFKASYTAVISGMDAVNDIGNIDVYPNPASHFLTVDIDKNLSGRLKLSLTSVTGQEVYNKQQYLDAGKNVLIIPFDNIASGLYFLNLKTERSVLNYRIIIE